MVGRFITYYRVSTDKQGRSGLGLEAQQHAVATFLTGRDADVIKTFTEVESGKRADRPELLKAIEACHLYGTTLLIAKLDRLSRNAAFLLTLKESGIDICAADMPEADAFMIGIMALVAEKEAEMISKRTRDALQAAKRRGVKLGNPNGAEALRRAQKGNTAAIEAIKAKADKHSARIKAVVEDIKAGGATSLQSIAGELNARGIPTRRGGQWHAASVRRVIVRESPEHQPL